MRIKVLMKDWMLNMIVQIDSLLATFDKNF